jgi:6-phosphofructokinase 1
VGERQRLGSLAVFTSGGDSAGMNAAVRAVVRTALHHGLDVFAVYEGYLGLLSGGTFIRRMASMDVAGLLHRGGSALGSARSEEFRTRDGRRRAARNLLEVGIDALVVIGGDGSLTGADIFRREWPQLLEELVEEGAVDRATVERHPRLRLAGLVGSIDNDMFGTNMTIGADTALHRITEALDAIHSTAASHQRSFVIEVMGRNCGYLALMSSLAAGANWVLIPESPPDTDDWEDAMCAALEAGRRIGRRQNMVIVAEGAHDRNGKPITSEYVKSVLEQRLGEDTRVTILGHVQRGGSPSAFDRYLGTLLGHAAVERLLEGAADEEAQLIGIRGHQVTSSPLMECVEQTHEVARRIAAQDYETAVAMRGTGFVESLQTFLTTIRSMPRSPVPGQRQLRLAVLHAGGPAPGMNTAARVAVRLGMDRGHVILGVRNGFLGLRNGDVQELDWMSVTEWTSRGGAELGISRFVPDDDALAAVAQQLQAHRVDGLLVIGGWSGYWAAHALHVAREVWPAFRIPIVCLPASINNDLPASEISVGSDTALNSIVSDVDKIKQSAVAARRCFVVEVMGHDCGYLALMSGLATGAERVYLPEEGITLDDLQIDVHALAEGFRQGKRLGLVINSEYADRIYTSGFMNALFEKEGGDLFDVREAILGHVQQGGNPSPFDRIQATRMAAKCVEFLAEQASSPAPVSAFAGLQAGRVEFTDLARLPDLVEPGVQRPVRQPWLSLRPMADVMAGRGDRQKPAPK